MEVAPRAELREHSGGPEPHPRRALDQRLDDHPGDSIGKNGMWCGGFRARDKFLHRCHVRHRKMKTRKSPMERIDPAEARRPHRVAVVGMREREESVALQLPPVLAALHRHLDRTLNGRAPVVGKKDARQRLRCILRPKRHQFFREPDRLWVGESQKRSVRHALQLLTNCGVDLRVPMSVQIGPNGRVAVDILAPFAVAQKHPLPFHQHQRFMFRRAPVPHLRERMPAMAFVGGDQ